MGRFIGPALVLAFLGFLSAAVNPRRQTGEAPFVMVLGIAQDGGYPQAGCAKECCREAWSDPSRRRFVVSLAIVDPLTNERWMVECTPDFPEQLDLLDRLAPPASDKRAPALDGILLTHAHIGHYAGLIHLGREVMGANGVPVFAMPRLRSFLESNGPWSQLVSLGNIELRDLRADEPARLNDRIAVTPFQVPHRDEYSETVGFRIDGPDRSVLFIPDIDKWEKWNRRIEDLIGEVDVAYLDGTFFADGEIPGRNMAEIPHPFVEESIARFSALPASERAKIRFIHLNHTNPALQPDSAARERVSASGLNLAVEGERQNL